MPKLYTCPTLFDSVKQINITNLKKWGYLQPNNIINGSIKWSINGKPSGNISIKVNTLDEHPHLELNYKYGEEPRNYKVHLISKLSNLGKGIIWHFVCPQTQKQCRKLYLVDGCFLHREAFNGCMYECQTQSKYYRFLVTTYGAYFETDRLYEQLYKKHFKKTYAGKPTKRYLRILKQLEKAENTSIEELNIMLMKN